MAKPPALVAENGLLVDLSHAGLLCPREFSRDTLGKLYDGHLSMERGRTPFYKTALGQDRKIYKWEAHKSV